MSWKITHIILKYKSMLISEPWSTFRLFVLAAESQGLHLLPRADSLVFLGIELGYYQLLRLKITNKQIN